VAISDECEAVGQQDFCGNGSGVIDRRKLLMAGGLFAFGASPVTILPAEAAQRGIVQTNNNDAFWPGGARLE